MKRKQASVKMRIQTHINNKHIPNACMPFKWNDMNVSDVLY